MPSHLSRRLFLAASGLLLPTQAHAHSGKAGDIKIGHAWALPTAVTDGQVFIPLLNTGKTGDALLSARSDFTTLIELRRNARYDDAPEVRFELEPGKPFPMRPQGPHLRLIGLAQPLVVGGRFPIILDFLASGEAEIEVHVETTPGQ